MSPPKNTPENLDKIVMIAGCKTNLNKAIWESTKRNQHHMCFYDVASSSGSNRLQSTLSWYQPEFGFKQRDRVCLCMVGIRFRVGLSDIHTRNYIFLFSFLSTRHQCIANYFVYKKSKTEREFCQLDSAPYNTKRSYIQTKHSHSKHRHP